MRAVIFDLDHTLFMTEDTLHEGVTDLLAILRRLDARVAGLSNKDHRILVRLEEAGIRQYFSQVLCADQNMDERIEPKEPAGVHHVLHLMRMAPEQAVLVSHAHGDILLGKDAGLVYTIGVSHGSGNVSPLHEAGADYIAEDIPAVLGMIG